MIIPVYNVEKYLWQCFNSLINQETSYCYELIFVNDGSTDSSLEIMQNFTYYPNVKIFTQENQGISAARNRGISEARGEFLGFIDSDDYVSADYIETLMHTAKHEDADIVKVSCLEFDSETNKILRHFYDCPEPSKVEGYIGEKVFNYDGFIWGGIYKKYIFNNIRFPVGYWHEDMIVSFLIYRMGRKFIHIPNEMYYKRQHQTNISGIVTSSSSVNCLDQFYLIKECIKMNKALGLPCDKVLSKLIYRECSFMLGLRTSALDNNIRKSVFVLASQLCKENYLNDYDLFSKALNKKDYRLWNYATMIERLRY